VNQFGTRRQFLRDLGISTAALPFILNLPSLGFANQQQRKQRLVIMFSPNGVQPETFWPEGRGEALSLQGSLTPLEPFRDRTLVLKGISDKVRGDGDSHMRGIGCLLTGVELFPGNVQGGGNTPAGWSSGISLDQELKNAFQAKAATRTRFGSLEFGVQVPDHADTWTRMVYAGPNKPLAPIGNPYEMFNKLYGRAKDQESLKSILDDVQDDLRKVERLLSTEDRKLVEEHASFVREMELDLKAADAQAVGHAVPQLEAGVKVDNDSTPRVSKMHIDLMVNSFAADFARVATLQYSHSVGGIRMRWLGINEGHHELSHKLDDDAPAQVNLTKINKWFCEQMAYLAKRLAETPEPGGGGSLLDNTLIVWTNELGKGNSHTLDNIPFVLVGGGMGFRMGRLLEYPRVAHNRLHLSLAHAMGHHIDRFGNPDFCSKGPLSNLT
jgi:Protein of unknown function (DUF1552)